MLLLSLQCKCCYYDCEIYIFCGIGFYAAHLSLSHGNGWPCAFIVLSLVGWPCAFIILSHVSLSQFLLILFILILFESAAGVIKMGRLSQCVN